MAETPPPGSSAACAFRPVTSIRTRLLPRREVFRSPFGCGGSRPRAATTPADSAGEVGDHVIARRRRYTSGPAAEFAVPADESIGERVEGVGRPGRCLVFDVRTEPTGHRFYRWTHK